MRSHTDDVDAEAEAARSVDMAGCQVRKERETCSTTNEDFKQV